MRRLRENRGFTLLEILIALVVLMVGLLGILAVFPIAMQAAASTVQDTYAAAIAQSVVDALNLGFRQMHARLDDGTAYLIFDHDGCRDLDQDRNGVLRNADLQQRALLGQIRTRDYCIVLPPPTDFERPGVPRAYLYPRKDPSAAGPPILQKVSVRVGDRTVDRPKVERTYRLGKRLETGSEVERADPYPQYSFAFTLRPAKAPRPDAPSPRPADQEVATGLYEVIVMVFRNFPDFSNVPYNPELRGAAPFREFVTYISE